MSILGKRTIPAAFTVTLGVISTTVLSTVLSAVLSQVANASGTIAGAAREDNLDQSRQLITAGADVNLPEPDGTTPLLWAVYNSSPELVQLLLDAGADPNIPNSLDITPLLQASRYGNADMISALLASGARFADIQFTTETPLMAAARSGSVEAVSEWAEHLTAQGVDFIGPVEHGIITSIYFRDPNNLRLELTADVIPEWKEHGDKATQDVADWQALKERSAKEGNHDGVIAWIKERRLTRPDHGAE